MRVYVSPNRKWRVEVKPDGACKIWWIGFLRHTAASVFDAADWLVANGIWELVED